MIKNLPGFLVNTLHWIISTQLVIACSALCLSFETLLLIGIPLKMEPVFFFIFFGALGIYNLALAGFHPLKPRVSKRLPYSYFTGLFSCMVAGMSLLFLPVNTIILAVAGLLLSVFYLYKWTFLGISVKIRSIPLLKNFVLAVIWAIVTVMLPLSIYHQGFSVSNTEVLIFFRRIFFILAIAIPYDIRDYRDDLKNKLQTLPVVIGIHKAKLTALFFLLCFGFFAFYHASNIVAGSINLAPVSIAFALSFILTAMLILYASAARKPYFFTLFLDGTMILQFVFVILSIKIWGNPW